MIKIYAIFYMVVLILGAGLLYVVLGWLRRLLAVVRRVVVYVSRATLAAAAALAGGMLTNVALPAMALLEPSPFLTMAALIVGITCACIAWHVTRKWSEDSEVGCERVHASPVFTASSHVPKAGTMPFEGLSQSPSPPSRYPQSPAARPIPAAPLVDPAALRRIDDLKRRLDLAISSDPLDTTLTEWSVVCERVPELIRTTQAVYDDAAVAERPALRAGLADDLQDIVTGGEARFAAREHAARMVARNRLTTLRAYVAGRTRSI